MIDNYLQGLYRLERIFEVDQNWSNKTALVVYYLVSVSCEERIYKAGTIWYNPKIRSLLLAGLDMVFVPEALVALE